MKRSDAIARRQLLEAGLIVAGAPFCPEALFRAHAADDRKANSPIGRREIVKGLDGMSRVADTGNNPFAGGHNAAAVISSAFFCREQKLGEDVQKEMLSVMEARLLKNPIYAAGRRRPPTRSSSGCSSRTWTPGSPPCGAAATTSSSPSPASRPCTRCLKR